jgi:hypothetical protein
MSNAISMLHLTECVHVRPPNPAIRTAPGRHIALCITLQYLTLYSGFRTRNNIHRLNYVISCLRIIGPLTQFYVLTERPILLDFSGESRVPMERFNKIKKELYLNFMWISRYVLCICTNHYSLRLMKLVKTATTKCNKTVINISGGEIYRQIFKQNSGRLIRPPHFAFTSLFVQGTHDNMLSCY